MSLPESKKEDHKMMKLTIQKCSTGKLYVKSCKTRSSCHERIYGNLIGHIDFLNKRQVDVHLRILEWCSMEHYTEANLVRYHYKTI